MKPDNPEIREGTTGALCSIVQEKAGGPRAGSGEAVSAAMRAAIMGCSTWLSERWGLTTH
jgi:hypothetical protein